MSELSRLRWLCRRGMKELDIVMTAYLDHEYESASADEQMHFKTLLDMPDPDLYALLLGRCQAAGDRVVDGVDLFPLPGVTPGSCGLLLPLPAATVVICGDAVATIEHIRDGKVLPTCVDIEQARDSFQEVIEIADVLAEWYDELTDWLTFPMPADPARDRDAAAVIARLREG